MPTHSVADAKNHLSELIGRALNGEEVIITRHGRPVVELRPVAAPPHRVTQADLDWLADRRMQLVQPRGGEKPISIVAELARMRDEDWR